MLVLSRKRDETVHLHTSDGLVTVMVVDVRGDRARLGFEAPPAVKIMRKEIEGTPPRNPPDAHGEKTP